MGKAGTVESFNALDLPAFIERLLPEVSLKFPARTTAATIIYDIAIESSQSIKPEEFAACFDLIVSTSKADYVNSSGGWHPRAKKRELKLPDLKYLLVRQNLASEVVGFAAFMLTYEDGIEVIYMYEIHLSDGLRGAGLGKHLVQIIQHTGEASGMEKVMLTVFKSNEGALSFYDRLGFSVDEFSPRPRKLRNGVVKEPDYAIMSKALNVGDGPKKGRRAG